METTPRVVLTSSDGDAATSEGALAVGGRGFIAKDELPDGSLISMLARVPGREYGEPVHLRVVIGEDDVLLREGIAKILEKQGAEVVAQTGDANDFLRRARAHRPDVAVIDVQMPPRNEDDGLRAALELRASHPEIGVLVLSQFFEESYATDLIGDHPEGVGYLLKERVGQVSTFVEAVDRVARGGTVLDPVVVARMLGRRRTGGALDTLTPREREVLREMAEGKTNGGIAESLTVTEAAIEKHVRNIFHKLGFTQQTTGHRRVLAVLKYMGESHR